jgi:hypothetical protein
MRTVIYDIPGQMSVDVAVEHMIAMVMREAALTPDVDVQVVGVHNSIELAVRVGSTRQALLDYWDKERHERAFRDERLHPVRVTIRYLLGTLSAEDRLLVIKELAVDPLSKEGV